MRCCPASCVWTPSRSTSDWLYLVTQRSRKLTLVTACRHRSTPSLAGNEGLPSTQTSGWFLVYFITVHLLVSLNLLFSTGCLRNLSPCKQGAPGSSAATAFSRTKKLHRYIFACRLLIECEAALQAGSYHVALDLLLCVQGQVLFRALESEPCTSTAQQPKYRPMLITFTFSFVTLSVESFWTVSSLLQEAALVQMTSYTKS